MDTGPSLSTTALPPLQRMHFADEDKQWMPALARIMAWLSGGAMALVLLSTGVFMVFMTHNVGVHWTKSIIAGMAVLAPILWASHVIGNRVANGLIRTRVERLRGRADSAL
jgi:hypothetical protein